MVSSGALTGLLLIFLICPDVEGHVRNLRQIMSFLQRNYSEGREMTVVINVPAANCSSKGKLGKGFLHGDSAWRVKDAMNSNSSIYRGQRLIAARPKPFNSMSSYHPEYLLLIQSNPPNNASYDPLLKELLNKDNQGCVVFYTFSSPCVNTCSTSEGLYNLLPALNLLKEHKGPKAFVFSRVIKRDFQPVQKRRRPVWQCYKRGRRVYTSMEVWDNYDSQVEWEKNVVEINSRVPLYRCEGTKCARCVHGHETDARCMHPISI